MKNYIKGTTLFVLITASVLLFTYGYLVKDDTVVRTVSRTQSAQTISSFDQGVAARWSFDENIGTTAADTNGGNNGSLNPLVSWVVGKINSAVQISQGGYIQTAPTTALSFGNGTADTSFSVSVWVNRGRTGVVDSIISKTDYTNNRFEYAAFLNSNDTIGFTLYSGTFGNVQIKAVSTASFASDANQWVNYVFSYDGSGLKEGIKIYRNGVLVPTVASSMGAYKAMQATSIPVFIGAFQPIGTYKSFFQGGIDDVRIYNRQLSSSDIESLYAQGNTGVATPPPTSAPTTPTNPPVTTPPTTQPPEATAPTNPGNWYVDVSATAGTKSGTSWQNAWTSLSAIDWSRVNPGDTVWLSGGIYPDAIKITKSGTAQSPIRVKASQEPGHNGFIIFQGGDIYADYIVFDGAKNDTYGDTVVGNSTLNVPKIKDNINIKSTHGIWFGSRNPIGIKMRWIEIVDDHVAGRDGININSSGHIYGNEFAYLWIHSVGQDGIHITYNDKPTWNDVTVKFCLIEDVADDGLEVPGGMTVHNNIIRFSRFEAGHPDGMQSSNNYIRFFNNIVSDFGSSLILTQGQAPEGGDYGHIHIFGNVFFKKDVLVSTTELELKWYPANSTYNRDSVNWTDWVIANNTFAYLNAGGISFTARPEMVKNINLSKVVAVNNVMYNFKGMGTLSAPYPTRTTVNSTTGATYTTTWNWSPSDFIFDHNIISTINPPVKFRFVENGTEYIEGKAVSYRGVFYQNAEELNAATPYKHNSSATPSFVDAANFDFALKSDDTAARDKGQDLTYLGVPNLGTDLRGSSRGINGAWDIGAIEAITGIPNNTPPIIAPPSAPSITQGLIQRISFDADDFTRGLFTDLSGTGNNADCQPAYSVDGKPVAGVAGGFYNQCPTIVPGPDSSNAARFKGSLCDMSGTYLAVKKSPSLATMPQGTISVWATFDSAQSTEKLLDARSLRKPNTWVLGKDGDQYNTFTVNNDLGTEIDVFTFPGGNEKANTWNNYTVSWDGVTIKGYYNGKLFTQAPMTSISALKLDNYLVIGALKHSEDRNTTDWNCTNQYGRPTFPQYQGTAYSGYVYPNTGYHNGAIDDVRIYNRPLSDAEVALVVGANIPSTYVLSVAKGGNGNGDISGVASGMIGIGCGKHCAESFPPNTSVTLTPLPTIDSVFSGWSGACSGTGPCVVTMNNDKKVTANFNRSYGIAASLDMSKASITAPFIVQSGVLSQPVDTTLAKSGKATFTFTVPQDGDYLVIGQVNAPSGSANSFYLNIDTEPVDETTAWHMYTTGGFEERIVSWGGNTSGGNPPHVFRLTAGRHTIILRGRETDVSLKSLLVVSKDIATNGTPSQPVGTDPQTDSTPPTVSITAPSTNTTVNGIVTLRASAADNVAIGSVRFMVNGKDLEPLFTTAPYSGSWDTRTIVNGAYVLTAIATDTSGNTTTSSPVTVIVSNPTNTNVPTAPAVNHPPVVDAGNNKVVTVPNKVRLEGSAVDQDGNNLTYAWSQVNGPSGVIANSAVNQISIDYQFSKPGVYTFRLTVSDGSVTSADDVTVSVFETAASVTSGGTTARPDSDGDGIADYIDRCPSTPAVLRSRVNALGCPLPRTATFTIKTDFNDVDLSKVEALELGTAAGKVLFTLASPIDISKHPQDANREFDIDSNLSIAKGLISLNSESLPALNKPAVITLNNISVKTPYILRDGIACDSCKIISYRDNTLTFVVQGFSTYSVIEMPVNGINQSTTPGFVLPGGQTTSSQNYGTGGNSSATVGSIGTLTPTVAQKAPALYVGGKFARNLTLGMSGADVKALQVYLNSKGFRVALIGPGSKGKESTFFGLATRRALIRYQISRNISPTSGYFGPLTRAKVNKNQ